MCGGRDWGQKEKTENGTEKKRRIHSGEREKQKGRRMGGRDAEKRGVRVIVFAGEWMG